MKQWLYEFKENTKDFFLNPNRNEDGSRMKGVNKQNVTAVLIAGFVGWLLLTITVGAKVKATLRKVPLIKMLFKNAPARRRAPARKRPAPRRRMRK